MRIAALAGAALVLAACAGASPPAAGTGEKAGKAAAMPVTSLANTRWTGVVDGSPDPRTLPRLEFTQDRIAGFTGCNMLSGAWRLENGEVRLGPLATTKRMCLGPAGDVEKRFLEALGSTSRVTREGNRLIFTAPSGARFEFTEAAAG